MNDTSQDSSTHSRGLSRYTYHPLSTAGNEIRLLRLSPRSDEVVCDVFHASMLHEFEALSYEWGEKNDLAEINLGGIRTPVTKNLKAALTQLQLADKDRVLWVDALSINQDNISERNEQVTKMASIYRSARTVIIWLGTETEDSARAMSALTSFHSSQAGDLGFRLAHKDMVAISNLCQRSYWWRAWIVQEVMSAQHAVIRSGQDSMEWHILQNFLNWADDRLERLVEDHGIAVVSVALGGPADLICRRPSLETAEKTLQDLRQTKASDARDHVFAFLGIVPELGAGTIVNYAHSVEVVYRDAVRTLIEQTGRLNVILYAASSSQRRRQTLPSWVPDWSAESSGINFEGRPSVARDSKAVARIQGNILTAQGFEVGYVTKIGVPCGPIPFPAVAELRQYAIAFYDWCTVIASSHVEGRNALYRFVLHLRTFPYTFDGLESQNDRTVLRYFIHLCETFLPDQVLPTYLDKYKPLHPQPFPSLQQIRDNHIFIAAFSNLFGRRLIISSSNDMGLAFSAVEVGDRICILLGCSRPVILRAQREGFMLISYADLEHMTHGEAMDGLDEGRYELREFDIH